MGRTASWKLLRVQAVSGSVMGISPFFLLQGNAAIEPVTAVASVGPFNLVHLICARLMVYSAMTKAGIKTS